MSPSTSREALCCCEYINETGEISHILGCFCDCEALDQVFDRVLSCRPVPRQLSERMWKTIGDRCRIPGLAGRGAVKVDLEMVVPIITVPLALCVGTVNSIMTILVLVLMPLVLFLFYRFWRKQSNRLRTKFFYVWAMTSVIFTYGVYLIYIIPFREILLWEHLTLFTSLVLMFVALKFVKQDPGFIKGNQSSSGKSSPTHENSNVIYKADDGYTKVLADNAMGNFLMSNMGFEKDSFKQNYEAQTAPSLPESEVSWIDSRPLKNNQLITWCDTCCLVKPARAGHCHVCQACIVNRDHHCVWVDNCIGGQNHRSFMVAIILFVFTGFYGSNLSLTTVCTPEMYYGWFLLPNDCRFVYSDFQTALCFVSACYAVLGTSLMLFALITQIIYISQNVTSQELHMAVVQGKAVLGLYAKHNVHNRGCLKNWAEFLCLKTRRKSPQIPV